MLLLLAATISNIVFSAPRHYVPGIEITYGQSVHAWNAYKTVKAARNDIPAVLSLLRKNYGTYQASFARAQLSLERIPLNSNWVLHTYLVGEAAAGAAVHNPVLPEINVAIAHAEYLNLKVERVFPQAHTLARFGILYGQGNETRIQGFVTDFLQATPRRRGHFSLYGMDLEAEHAYKWSDNARQLQTVLFRPTWYRSLITENEFILGDRYPRFSTYRYKLKSQLAFRSESSYLPHEYGPEFIFGPQPLPVEMLPRIWEYVHQIYAWPELGTMLGASLVGRWWFNQFQVIARGGVYAGYWGSFLSFKWKESSFDISYAGIEESAAYRTRGQRLWLAKLGIRF